ncbi:MAG: GNAT family N-acetyltransferase [Clostridium sp.]|nr:GNAT family N-acetyltransferase [Clostridium sp.]
MEFIRINTQDSYYFKKMMAIYEISFPIFEQRTLNNQIEVLQEQDYYCTAVCEEAKLVGIIWYWNLDEMKYIEHLAISPDLRGKGYGSKILKSFCEDNEKVMLEIDPPNDDISIRRLKFYSNLGFKLQDFQHTHPPYRKGYKGHSLKIMSLKTQLAEEEYEKFNAFLIERIMVYSEYGNERAKSLSINV